MLRLSITVDRYTGTPVHEMRLAASFFRTSFDEGPFVGVLLVGRREACAPTEARPTLGEGFSLGEGEKAQPWSISRVLEVVGRGAQGACRG